MDAMSLGKIVISAAISTVWGCSLTPGYEYTITEKETETDTAKSADACFQLREVRTSEVSPAGVRTVFQLLDCTGAPVSDLKSDELSVRLDGEALQSEGGHSPVLNEKVDFEQYALLLLDLSDSIVESGNLTSMVDSARTLVNRLREEGVRIAIYRFAGPRYFAEVQSFTTDEDLLDAALDDIAKSEGLGTTDLYGSIRNALGILNVVGKKLPHPQESTRYRFTHGSYFITNQKSKEKKNFSGRRRPSSPCRRPSSPALLPRRRRRPGIRRGRI